MTELNNNKVTYLDVNVSSEKEASHNDEDAAQNKQSNGNKYSSEWYFSWWALKLQQ